MPTEDKTFMIEDAQIIFRNFSGEETKFNKAGDRNFAVVIDQKTADELAADGWNVKVLESREEGEPGTLYVPIAVGYKFYPPNVTMITSKARTRLTENSVGVLDWAEFLMCDLIARGYQWDVNGKSGLKAYLKTMFVTIDEDPLEQKYAVEEGM